jgi:Na+/melibiose symporter-like transporter
MQEINHAIYLVLASALTLWVAQTLYRSGAVFLNDAFHGDAPRASAVNHLMRVGFCLGNLGFVALLLGVGRKPDTLIGSTEYVIGKLGLVMLVLGAAYLINLLALATIAQSARRSQPAHLAMSSPPLPRPAP